MPTDENPSVKNESLNEKALLSVEEAYLPEAERQREIAPLVQERLIEAQENGLERRKQIVTGLQAASRLVGIGNGTLETGQIPNTLEQLSNLTGNKEAFDVYSNKMGKALKGMFSQEARDRVGAPSNAAILELAANTTTKITEKTPKDERKEIEDNRYMLAGVVEKFDDYGKALEVADDDDMEQLSNASSEVHIHLGRNLATMGTAYVELSRQINTTLEEKGDFSKEEKTQIRAHLKALRGTNAGNTAGALMVLGEVQENLGLEIEKAASIAKSKLEGASSGDSPNETLIEEENNIARYERARSLERVVGQEQTLSRFADIIKAEVKGPSGVSNELQDDAFQEEVLELARRLVLAKVNEITESEVLNETISGEPNLILNQQELNNRVRRRVGGIDEEGNTLKGETDIPELGTVAMERQILYFGQALAENNFAHRDAVAVTAKLLAANRATRLNTTIVDESAPDITASKLITEHAADISITRRIPERTQIQMKAKVPDAVFKAFVRAEPIKTGDTFETIDRKIKDSGNADGAIEFDALTPGAPITPENREQNVEEPLPIEPINIDWL